MHVKLFKKRHGAAKILVVFGQNRTISAPSKHGANGAPHPRSHPDVVHLQQAQFRSDRLELEGSRQPVACPQHGHVRPLRSARLHTDTQRRLTLSPRLTIRTAPLFGWRGFFVPGQRMRHPRNAKTAPIPSGTVRSAKVTHGHSGIHPEIAPAGTQNLIQPGGQVSPAAGKQLA